MNRITLLRCALAGLIALAGSAAGSDPANARRPQNDADLRFWLENMVWYHHFTTAEIVAATALTETEIAAARKRFNLASDNRPARPANAPLLVLPYPGGRHPRLGFLEGALNPQRETKISVFTPWDEASYVVVDMPEALWSNLGLTYLAHTHIDTIWTRRGVTLPKQEWNRRAGNVLDMERKLPNGISFGARVVPTAKAVRLELWLRNGTSNPLSGLRVQNCVLLNAAKGFGDPIDANKVLKQPYAACGSTDRTRWIITAWVPCERTWSNPPVPCMHSDPQFPDCAPGETQRVSGWLSFYEGTDLAGEIQRINQTGWQKKPAAP